MPPFEPDQFESRGRRDFFLASAFLILAGILVVLPPQGQEQVASALRGTVLAPFLLIQESLHQARVRTVDISELQSQLDAATAALAAQQTLRHENTRLRELLDLRERAGPGFRSASVIRPGVRGSESMLLLDVGREDGVRVNDPVVSADGLLGVIREVTASTSVAMDWTHPDFRVSAMTLDGAAFGLVEPRSGAFREEDRLLLNGVPYYTTLEPGTAVVTSGRGSVYPRGILVGVVDALAETEAGWRRGYWLIPAVEPAAVGHVLVMVAPDVEGNERLAELWVDSLPVAPDGPEALEEVDMGPSTRSAPPVDPGAHGAGVEPEGGDAPAEGGVPVEVGDTLSSGEGMDGEGRGDLSPEEEDRGSDVRDPAREAGSSGFEARS